MPHIFDEIVKFIWNLNTMRITLILTSLLLVSNVMEKLFNKKFIGSWVWNKIYKFFTYPMRISKAILVLAEGQEHLRGDIAVIKKEVTLNGGGSLKDSNVRQEKALTQVLESQKLIEEVQTANIGVQSIPTFKVNLRREWTFVNPALLKMLKASSEEVLGHGYRKFIPYPEMVRLDKEREPNPSIPYVGEVEFIVDGEPLYTYCRTAQVRNTAGEVLYLLGTFEILE
jgi:PAS domain-containing protein